MSVTLAASTMHFFKQTPHDLEAWCQREEIPRHVGAQMLGWVYRHGIVDPEKMTNIGRAHRRRIAECFRFDRGGVDAHEVASDGTQKLLLAWSADATDTTLPVLADTPRTECVLIPTPERQTACISSQVGCPVGCTFCASGLGGLEGNLTSGQIVEQVHRLARLPDVDRITNVVFMGMGEPLANISAVTNAIRTLNAPWGMGIGARRITISTVGLPAAIRRLIDFEIPVKLALSLHAPNDDLRRKLIPWAEYAPITELFDACQAYFKNTGREITLEYLLLRGVNDRTEHASQLVGVARRLRANVNLIRYNEVKGLPFDRPTSDDVRQFQRVLRAAGVNTHIRASRGRDIAAACGQLRHETAGKR